MVHLHYHSILLPYSRQLISEMNCLIHIARDMKVKDPPLCMSKEKKYRKKHGPSGKIVPEHRKINITKMGLATESILSPYTQRLILIGLNFSHLAKS